MLSIIEFEWLRFVPIIPVGEDKTHALGERGLEGLEIIAALLLQHDFIYPLTVLCLLGERCAKPPEG